jgi:hypothetical protein
VSDSNGRPFGCKPNALTAELTALNPHIVHHFGALRQIPDRNSWKSAKLYFSISMALVAAVTKDDVIVFGATEQPSIAVALHSLNAASTLILVGLGKGHVRKCFLPGTT